MLWAPAVCAGCLKGVATLVRCIAPVILLHTHIYIHVSAALLYYCASSIHLCVEMIESSTWGVESAFRVSLHPKPSAAYIYTIGMTEYMYSTIRESFILGKTCAGTARH